MRKTIVQNPQTAKHKSLLQEDQIYNISTWADAIMIMYSVTDMQSYTNALQIYNNLLSSIAFVSIIYS